MSKHFISAKTIAASAMVIAFGFSSLVFADSNACQFGAAKWGPGDEAGQSNTQTPAKAMEAAKLIKTGKIFRLGHEYFEGMPHLSLPGIPLIGYESDIPSTFVIAIPGLLAIQEEEIQGEITQVGTQTDALGHVCKGDPSAPEGFSCYNGFLYSDILPPFDPNNHRQLQHLGIENIKPYFTRGILLDVRKYANNNQMMVEGQAVTMDMIRQTMVAEHLSENDIEEGDVILIRTGWEDLFNTDPARYIAGNNPGIDLEVAQFFAGKCVGNIGADNVTLEVQPSVDPGLLPVHQFTLAVAGLPQQENLALKEFAEAIAAENTDSTSKKYIFTYIFNPVPYTGASGSNGVPIAVR